MTNLLQDLRYGFRVLRKDLRFTIAAVVTLALAIAANTAIFSVVNGIILQPLPYEDPDRLFMLWTTLDRQELDHERSAFANFEDWRKQSRSFEDLAAFDPYSATLTGAEVPDQIGVVRTTPNLFRLMGTAPMVGRTFSPEQAERRERLVVLSHGAWLNRFSAAKDVIGKTIHLDGRAFEIIGVMPEGFDFPDHAQMWEPHTLSPGWEKSRRQRGTGPWFVIGRLKPRAGLQEAQSEMDALAKQLASAFPKNNAGLGVRLVRLDREIAGPNVRAALWILLGAVVVLLLIACTNVANLQLARASRRQREFALRTALGAGRSRLVRQLITETAVLLLAAGSLGLLLGDAAVETFKALGRSDIPRLDEIRLDTHVLIFTVLASGLAGVFVALAPLAGISRAGLGQTLKEGGRGMSAGRGAGQTRAVLVASQFTLAVVLLAGAGLLVRSFQRIQQVDPGFRSDRVLLMQVSALRSRTPSQAAAFYRELVERVGSIREVQSAGAVNDFFIGGGTDVIVAIEGRELPEPERRTQLRVDSATPGYFQTVGVPLVSGRFFSDQDGPNAPPVAIVNQTAAKRFWPGENAVGKRLKLGSQPELQPWITVAGVVGDMRRQGLDKPPLAQAFRPHAQSPSRLMSVLVRTASDPLRVAGLVRSEVHAIDKNVPVYQVSTLASRVGRTVSQRRFQTWLLGIFSAVALLLAMIGIYGLMHHTVAERTHEIGIRMALGARAGDVQLMVIRQGLKPALTGLGIGLALALALARTISSLLYEVTPADPVTFAVVTLVLIGVAAAACYIPARRAARVDPMTALRYE